MASQIRLNTELYSWWGNFIGQQKASFGRDFELNTDGEGSPIFISSGGSNQLIGFDFTTHVEATAYFARQGERKKRDRGLVPEVSFFAFNMDVSSELEESISAALEGDLDLSVERSFISVNGVGCGIKERFDEELASRLGRSSARQKAFYGETFENPSLYFGSTSYSGPDKVGVLVRAPVIRIPTGDGGEISGNLFAYARKYFMGPLSIAVPKADLKE